MEADTLMTVNAIAQRPDMSWYRRKADRLGCSFLLELLSDEVSMSLTCYRLLGDFSLLSG